MTDGQTATIHSNLKLERKGTKNQKTKVDWPLVKFYKYAGERCLRADKNLNRNPSGQLQSD